MSDKIPDNQPIIFFDGVCGLCNGFVDFIISVDKKRIFRFATLQGEAARKVLQPQDYENLDSVAFYQSGKVLKKSAAVIEILKGLGGGWQVAGVLQIVPPSIANFFYDLTANNRYKLFGKKETCRIPTKEERSLFLD